MMKLASGTVYEIIWWWMAGRGKMCKRQRLKRNAWRGAWIMLLNTEALSVDVALPFHCDVKSLMDGCCFYFHMRQITRLGCNLPPQLHVSVHISDMMALTWRALEIGHAVGFGNPIGIFYCCDVALSLLRRLCLVGHKAPFEKKEPEHRI